MNVTRLDMTLNTTLPDTLLTNCTNTSTIDNTTRCGSSQDEKPPVNEYLTGAIFLIFELIVGLIILVSNSLVIAILYRKEILRNATSTFMISLASCDLYNAFSVFHCIVVDFNLYTGHLGSLLACELCTLTANSAAGISSSCLLFVCLERYVAVAYPYAHAKYITQGVVKMIVAIVWCVWIGLTGFFTFFYIHWSWVEGDYCWSTFLFPYYVFYILAAPVMLASVLSMVIYSLIFRIAAEKAKQIAAEQQMVARFQAAVQATAANVRQEDTANSAQAAPANTTLDTASAGQQGKAGNLGQQEKAGNLGQQGKAGNLGQQGKAGNLGQQGKAGNLGQQGKAGNLGQQGKADNLGQQGKAGNLGQQGKAVNEGQLGMVANAGQQDNAAGEGQQEKAGSAGQQGNAANAGQQGNTANAGQQGNTANDGQQGNATNTGLQGNAGNAGQQVAANAAAKAKSENKVTKMMALMFGAFFFCYLPLILILIMGSNVAAVPFIIARLSWLLFLSNSFMNPIIFFWKSPRFRHALKQLLHIVPHNSVAPEM